MVKIALLSSKGQITIPKKLQKALNISPRSKLALYPQKGVLLVRPLKTSITEQTAGSLANYISPKKIGIPFEAVLEETKKLASIDLAKK